MGYDKSHQQKLIDQMDNYQPEIVWIATWKGYKARISSKNSSVPNWVHEGGNKVKWRCIKGKEHLEAINKSKAKKD
jgi:hypothetical protein